MAYLIIEGFKSRCSCDQHSSVDLTATGHYDNIAPDYWKSGEPCGEKWDYYVSSYYPPVECKQAVVPWNKDRIA